MVPSEARNSGVLLTDLTKSYGDVKAVRGVNISIRPGETLALLGPNGAGNSTTIDMMLGLTRPDSGTVTLFGSSPADAVQAGVVGGMLQTGSLLGYLSVRARRHGRVVVPPSPGRERGTSSHRHHGVRRSPDHQTLRRSDPTGTNGHCPRRRPGSAGTRRTDGRPRRGGTS